MDIWQRKFSLWLIQGHWHRWIGTCIRVQRYRKKDRDSVSCLVIQAADTYGMTTVPETIVCIQYKDREWGKQPLSSWNLHSMGCQRVNLKQKRGEDLTMLTDVWAEGDIGGAGAVKKGDDGPSLGHFVLRVFVNHQGRNAQLGM
jgi:hypothetical protein